MVKSEALKNQMKLTNNFIVKYKKPKILLIDTEEEVVNEISSAGFNVSVGTFGVRYSVEISSELIPIHQQDDLPNYPEKEIIIIDLKPPNKIKNPKQVMAVHGEKYVVVKSDLGIIDTRPYSMITVQKSFNRIFYNGGLFVVFARPRLNQQMFIAERFFDKYPNPCPVLYNNWSFLSILSGEPYLTEIKSEKGEEIEFYKPEYKKYSFLKEIIKNAEFYSTFEIGYKLNKDFEPLLTNKFGDIVGGIIKNDLKGGRILILPDVSKKAKLIKKLFYEFLPELSPHLFPDFEGFKWIQQDKYELDSTLLYKKDKIKVELEAKKRIKDIDEEINKERKKYSFLYGIITKNGRGLVGDIKLCLEFIEFNEVLDVDKENENKDSIMKQEDLQIKDGSPILLIEVKGLSGTSRESDTFQVVKYINRRMKKMNRTDIRGISIINHQKNIPALQRDNENVFTDQQIEDAKSNDCTILTTWDLFLLIKGMIKWKWNGKVIRELFYKSGRMPRIPAHYKCIGKVVNYWVQKKVVGIKILKNKLHQGDRISYIIPEGYLEEDVLSLQFDKRNVEEVSLNQLAGIKTVFSKNELKKGTLVYKVNN